MTPPLHAQDSTAVHVLAAGSLRAALNEIAAAFSSATGVHVDNGFGPSGVLRERIEKGEHADLFASADMDSPRALLRAGKAGPVVLFARNELCALVRPGLAITAETLLPSLLDPAVKLATSTPKADPLGDYTWTMFAKADAIKPGSRTVLEAKALQLMGDTHNSAPPPGMDLFAWHVHEGRADIFLAYCSAGAGFLKDLPGGTVVHLPPQLATGADYGLTVLPTQNQHAAALALFILSQDGQKLLAQNGFDAPLLSPPLH
jgi:ABC-type molybdate transport system substrate-binding protein